MKKVAEKFSKFMDIFGVYLPTLSFTILFVCFMATMILRYCFKYSLNWGSELAVLCYIWIMSFGSGKGLSLGDHVVFSLVYDRCPAIVQTIMKVVYNIIICVLLLVALPACVKAMLRSNMITGVLKIPYKIGFAPFLFMLVDNAVRALFEVKKVIVEYREAKNNPVSEEVAE